MGARFSEEIFGRSAISTDYRYLAGTRIVLVLLEVMRALRAYALSNARPTYTDGTP